MVKTSSAPGSKLSRTNSGNAEPRGHSFSGSRASDLLGHMSPTLTAVMVDAECSLRPARKLFGSLTPQQEH